MERLKNNDFSTLPEVHACTAGLKSITTSVTAVSFMFYTFCSLFVWNYILFVMNERFHIHGNVHFVLLFEFTQDGIEECRKLCGGHGYLCASGLPELYAVYVPACTYEGDNTILLLQVLILCLYIWILGSFRHYSIFSLLYWKFETVLCVRSSLLLCMNFSLYESILHIVLLFPTVLIWRMDIVVEQVARFLLKTLSQIGKVKPVGTAAYLGNVKQLSTQNCRVSRGTYIFLWSKESWEWS